MIPIAFWRWRFRWRLAGGGEGGFDAVVISIESQYHVQATHIPFMGFVSLVAGKATHDGVSGLHMAEFDSFTEAGGRRGTEPDGRGEAGPAGSG